MLAELKQCFMEAYDDNQDGKIDIREVKKKRLTKSSGWLVDWRDVLDWHNQR